MGNVLIRAAKRSDYEALAQLQLDSWQTSYNRFLPARYLHDQAPLDLMDQWRNMRLKADDFILVAFRDDHTGPAGFLSVRCRPAPFIDNLHCATAIRSRGTGQALMQAAFDRLRSRNKTSASLSVLVGNDAAKRFYLRLGATPGRVCREVIGDYPVDTEYMHWANF
ncbi:L-amino acid N-acyltransferase YncA [Cohaesibacter sp. ES.047]|uniref:GNAT family N-acetyltransferase n=1 Tax=Cohaesibacter sp. ES.047 TaxID=1798205 RepID=UPI000BBF719F|nr:GNAT family N-acetyltransferase [Cohaesibacter sp. ES.047]SNY92595.1 L-amino acid N-acyltransferase YncA [Cohaesibacter sp. ES.047]